VKTGIDAVAGNPAAISVAGALLALAWAWTGISLGRAQQKIAAEGERITG
jgi:AAA family ATP:ADP antiporter